MMETEGQTIGWSRYEDQTEWTGRPGRSPSWVSEEDQKGIGYTACRRLIDCCQLSARRTVRRGILQHFRRRVYL